MPLGSWHRLGKKINSFNRVYHHGSVSMPRSVLFTPKILILYYNKTKNDYTKGWEARCTGVWHSLHLGLLWPFDDCVDDKNYICAIISRCPHYIMYISHHGYDTTTREE